MNHNDYGTLMRELEAANAYLNLPVRHGQTPMLLAVGGLPGSGKSTLGLALAAEFNAVQLRADAIRKHVGGVPLDQKGPDYLYTPEHSQLSNEHLLMLTQTLLERKWNVIVDATHVSPHARANIENMAWEIGVEFKGLWCHAPGNVLHERIAGRTGDVSDADVAVLKGFIERNGERIPDLTVAWDIIDASQTPQEMFKQAAPLVHSLARNADRC